MQDFIRYIPHSEEDIEKSLMPLMLGK